MPFFYATNVVLPIGKIVTGLLVDHQAQIHENTRFMVLREGTLEEWAVDAVDNGASEYEIEKQRQQYEGWDFMKYYLVSVD